MFTQFRVRYPKGCLISELVTIKHGKYVVRVMVQVEGVTQATGLAAAETVELAEDQARTRALAVLGIYPTTQNDVSVSVAAAEQLAARSAVVAPHFAKSEIDTYPVSGEVPVPKPASIPIPQPAFSSEQPRPGEPIPIFSETFGINKDAAGLSSKEPKRPDASDSIAPPMSWETNPVPFGDDFSLGELEMLEEGDASELETPPVMPPKPAFGEPSFRMEHKANQGMPESQINLPVTPAPKFSYGQPQTNTGEMAPLIDSADMSDIIARTDVEMKRLGWSTKQGRDHLVQTYGKRGRAQLTNEELLDFLHYLEAQPSPDD